MADWKTISSETNAAKGDIQTHNGVQPASLPVGPDGSILITDSSQAVGMRWLAAGPAGWILGASPSGFGWVNAVGPAGPTGPT
jgi:hypothetical protein